MGNTGMDYPVSPVQALVSRIFRGSVDLRHRRLCIRGSTLVCGFVFCIPETGDNKDGRYIRGAGTNGDPGAVSSDAGQA